MEYGVIGEHLPHSFSPEIHKELANYHYIIQELTPEELPSFLKNKDFKGINVTIPYKRDVMPFLDEIDPIATQIGAVNTILHHHGKLYGYNTDFDGLSALISHVGVSIDGKKVLVLGTGGTSMTAVAVAKHGGASAVYRVSRHPKDAYTVSYEQAVTIHRDADVIINTTPVGMFPHIHSSPINITEFEKCSGVIDAVYNPLRSELVQQAQALGIPAAGGLYMLVAQAAKAAALFLDDESVMNKTAEVFSTLQSQKENIVLIGMPGSGKTTISDALGRALGRPVWDTDARIVEKNNMAIKEIFDKYGETEFRRLEAETIAELASQNGCIIATGGGAVLNEENVRHLKKNGRLIWLDRPLEQLIPTNDRPLSSKRSDMEALYTKRLPIYRSVADVRIENTAIETTLDTIIRMWKQ